MSSGERVARLLIESGAVLLRPEEPFQFSSGILSPIYCDNRILLSEPDSRATVVDAFLSLIGTSPFTQVVGVATAGIAWAGWIAERTKARFGYVRGASKDHGRKNQVEGNLKTGLDTLLVEDLVSTGGSVISAYDALADAGIEVSRLVSIFSYGFEEAKGEFEKRELAFSSIVTFDELLNAAEELKRISKRQREAVLTWKKNPRAWSPTQSPPPSSSRL